MASLKDDGLDKFKDAMAELASKKMDEDMMGFHKDAQKHNPYEHNPYIGVFDKGEKPHYVCGGFKVYINAHVPEDKIVVMPNPTTGDKLFMVNHVHNYDEVAKLFAVYMNDKNSGKVDDYNIPVGKSAAKSTEIEILYKENPPKPSTKQPPLQMTKAVKFENGIDSMKTVTSKAHDVMKIAPEQLVHLALKPYLEYIAHRLEQEVGVDVTPILYEYHREILEALTKGHVQIEKDYAHKAYRVGVSLLMSDYTLDNANI